MILGRNLPKEKVELVRGIRAGAWSRQRVADYFQVPPSEVECWERAYDIALQRGWTQLPSQRIERVAA